MKMIGLLKCTKVFCYLHYMPCYILRSKIKLPLKVTGTYISKNSFTTLIIWKRKMSEHKDGSQGDNKQDHLERTANNSREAGVHLVTVSDVTSISKTVKEIELTVTVKEVRPSFSFKAGQWVDLFIPDVETVGGFSMTSSPQELEQNGKMKLAIKYSTHPPALWMHTKCQLGDNLRIRIGGNFHLMKEENNLIEKQRRILLVAGGVGINPICSIARFLEDAKMSGKCHPSTRICLLYSAKTTDELIFKATFDDFHHKDSNFLPTYFITSNETTQCQPGLKVQERRISTSDLQSAIAWLLEGCTPVSIENFIEAYVCGPPSMITDITKELFSLNLKHVFYEKWW